MGPIRVIFSLKALNEVFIKNFINITTYMPAPHFLFKSKQILHTERLLKFAYLLPPNSESVTEEFVGESVHMCVVLLEFKKDEAFYSSEMKKVDARGEDIKPGRLGLWSSLLWPHAIGRIWPIFAVRLYDSRESLRLTQYSVYKGVKAVPASNS